MVVGNSEWGLNNLHTYIYSQRRTSDGSKFERISNAFPGKSWSFNCCIVLEATVGVAVNTHPRHAPTSTGRILQVLAVSIENTRLLSRVEYKMKPHAMTFRQTQFHLNQSQTILTIQYNNYNTKNNQYSSASNSNCTALTAFFPLLYYRDSGNASQYWEKIIRTRRKKKRRNNNKKNKSNKKNNSISLWITNPLETIPTNFSHGQVH